MKIHAIYHFRKTLAFTLMVVALGVFENSAKAQQFRTGVNLSVTQQPGTAYFNPAQRQYLAAVQQRQNALSNYGTAVNLQAARMSAYRQQLESYRKAQQARYQSRVHYLKAQQLWKEQSQKAAQYWNKRRSRAW